MGFKVNDKVRLKDTLVVYTKYGEGRTSVYLVQSMLFLGAKKVERITDNGLIVINGFIYSPEMLDLVESTKEPILDKAEKRYLENVLRPFKNRVEYIRKVPSMSEYKLCHLYIELNDCYLTFPYFDRDTMYKGLEIFEEYTLEKLGLFAEKNLAH